MVPPPEVVGRCFVDWCDNGQDSRCYGHNCTSHCTLLCGGLSGQGSCVERFRNSNEDEDDDDDDDNKEEEEPEPEPDLGTAKKILKDYKMEEEND